VTDAEPRQTEDETLSALEALAVTAEETARDQKAVARAARTMADRRQRGWPWAKILDDDRPPGVLNLLGSAVRRLTATSARVRSELARALSDEGHSTRHIARRFGVTHQRISSMLQQHAARSQRAPRTSSPASLTDPGASAGP